MGKSIVVERKEGSEAMAVLVHDETSQFAVIGLSDLPYPLLSVPDFWELCLRLYEELGYMNNVNIKVKGMAGGPVKLISRPRDDL